jgi:hypothetical protein
MSVKSTVDLTRDEAEARYLQMMVELYGLGRCKLSDTDLVDALADMNDRLKGGEGFENYRIVRVIAPTEPA